MLSSSYNGYYCLWWCRGLTQLLFKSKCSECVVCSKDGCFFLKRDVQTENEESKMELKHMPSPRRDSYIV